MVIVVLISLDVFNIISVQKQTLLYRMQKKIKRAVLSLWGGKS